MGRSGADDMGRSGADGMGRSGAIGTAAACGAGIAGSGATIAGAGIAAGAAAGAEIGAGGIASARQRLAGPAIPAVAAPAEGGMYSRCGGTGADGASPAARAEAEAGPAEGGRRGMSLSTARPISRPWLAISAAGGRVTAGMSARAVQAVPDCGACAGASAGTWAGARTVWLLSRTIGGPSDGVAGASRLQADRAAGAGAGGDADGVTGAGPCLPAVSRPVPSGRSDIAVGARGPGAAHVCGPDSERAGRSAVGPAAAAPDGGVSPACTGISVAGSGDTGGAGVVPGAMGVCQEAPAGHGDGVSQGDGTGPDDGMTGAAEDGGQEGGDVGVGAGPAEGSGPEVARRWVGTWGVAGSALVGGSACPDQMAPAGRLKRPSVPCSWGMAAGPPAFGAAATPGRAGTCRTGGDVSGAIRTRSGTWPIVGPWADAAMRGSGGGGLVANDGGVGDGVGDEGIVGGGTVGGGTVGGGAPVCQGAEAIAGAAAPVVWRGWMPGAGAGVGTRSTDITRRAVPAGARAAHSMSCDTGSTPTGAGRAAGRGRRDDVSAAATAGPAATPRGGMPVGI
ncbi:hypothetical protein GCM10011505_20850 [Tistrella bauzanensis]|uniref:Uncharacterized protein n=1 Tax=Tistrella bauzanensis TaxID=657419 RepID=A0ABQ1IJH8_9PROT|nr:hypothetical protein GCM10011505_20850 [Tistrella bauzanensis]